MLLVVITACSVQSQPHRQKRDLKFMKSFLYNTIFGKETSPASPALPALVIRHSPGKYRVIGTPVGYKSLYIRRYPQDIIVKDVKTPTADNLGILESYLGTKTQQQSLSALEDVKNLLQTGIIAVNKETQAQVKGETVQPQKVQYEVPTVGVNEDGVYSYELHLPSDDQPKVFSQTLEVPEPKVGSLVSGEGRTSYEVPLSIVQGLQNSEQPVLSISSSEEKEVPAKIVTSPVIVQNVERVIKIPKLETNSRFNTIPVQPIASSSENGFYYTQVQSDGSIAYYRDDGTAVRTSPKLSPNSGNLIPTIPRYILERMQKISSPVDRNYSYKLVKNIDSNSKLYLSRVSDKAIINDIHAKGYTVIDNGYKATYNVPSKYSYKQISLDGNTLYYNDNSKNNIANPLKSFGTIPREFLFQRMKYLTDNIDSRKYNVDGFDKSGLIINKPFTSRYVYNSVPVNSETYSKERVQNSREDSVLNNKYGSSYYYKLINPDGATLYYNGKNVVNSQDYELKKEQKTPLTNFSTYPNGRFNSLSTQTQESSGTSNPYLSRVEVRVNEPNLKNNQIRPSDPFFYSYSQTGGNYLSQKSNDLVNNQEKDKSYENVNQSTVLNTDNPLLDPKYSTKTTHTDGQYSYLQINTDGSDSQFGNEEKDNSNIKYSENNEKDEPNKLTLYAPGQYSHVKSKLKGETSNFNIEKEKTSSKLYANSVLPKLNEGQPNFRVTTDNLSAKPSEAAIEYSTKVPKDGHSLSIQRHNNNNFSYVRPRFEGKNSVKVGLSTVSSTPSATSSQSSYSYKLVQGTKNEESSTECNKGGDFTTKSNCANKSNNIKDMEQKTEKEHLKGQNPVSLEENPIVVLPIDHSYSYSGSNFDGSSVDVQGVDGKVLVDIRFGEHQDENEDSFEHRGDV